MNYFGEKLAKWFWVVQSPKLEIRQKYYYFFFISLYMFFTRLLQLLNLFQEQKGQLYCRGEKFLRAPTVLLDEFSE